MYIYLLSTPVRSLDETKFWASICDNINMESLCMIFVNR